MRLPTKVSVICYSLLLPIYASCNLAEAAVALSDPITQNEIKTIKLTKAKLSDAQKQQIRNSPKVVLKSTSNLCHTTESDYRTRIKIKDDSSNIFFGLNDCTDSGGDLTTKDRNKLSVEDSEAVQEMETTIEGRKSEEEALQKFAGINWGLGLAFTGIRKSYVSDVTIESDATNSFIRINHQTKNRALLMLESHYFIRSEKDPKFGHGPFMSIGVVGEDGVDPLSNYGLGWMIGLRTDDKGGSWNFGVGVFIDTKVPQLRSGLSDGEITTETDPTKLLTTSDVDGWMIMFSATF